MEKVSLRIIKYNKDRLPDMVQLKYSGMSESLYRFFRGTNNLFYEDLQEWKEIPQSPKAWICGDLHLENFGTYKSDNRLVYFDLNDFDDAVLAPVAYEVTRMVTSIFVAFDSLGIDEKKALNIAQLFLKNYSTVLANGKTDYIEPQTAKGIVCEFLTAVSTRKIKDFLKKRVEFKNQRVKFRQISKQVELTKAFKKELSCHITTWLHNDGNSPYNYKVLDSKFRIAGTGSLGQKRYVILLKSLNDIGEKYLLLDMKQSIASSVLPYTPIKQRQWKSEAERIIEIQRRMQNRPPALLSSTIFKNEHYVIEELQPTEDSIDFKFIRKDYRAMCQVIADMAMLTASSQLRSSGRQGSDIADNLIAFGENNNWQEKIIHYAIEYSHKIKTDYMAYLIDFKKGMFKMNSVKPKSSITKKTKAA